MNYLKGNLLSTHVTLTTMRNMSTVYSFFYCAAVSFFIAWYEPTEKSVFLMYFDTYR